MEQIIKVNKLKKFYNRGKIKAVNDVSLNLTRGKVYGLIGPNGAGKTTFVKLLLGAIKPTEGSITIYGNDAGSKNANKKIGYVCEKTAIPLHEDPYEYLIFMAVLSNIEIKKARSLVRKYLNEFGLKDFMYQKMKTFSSGMKKKVQIISAMLSNPEILILDEPTANLDPKARYEIFNFIKESVISQSKTVILCSHNLFELEKIVDNIIMINKGKLVIQGSYKEIVAKLNNSEQLVVHTKNDQLLIRFLKEQTDVLLHNTSPITISSSKIDQVKDLIVEFCFKNKVTLEEMNQRKESLYEVFDFFNRDESDGDVTHD